MGDSFILQTNALSTSCPLVLSIPLIQPIQIRSTNKKIGKEKEINSNSLI